MSNNQTTKTTNQDDQMVSTTSYAASVQKQVYLIGGMIYRCTADEAAQLMADSRC